MIKVQATGFREVKNALGKAGARELEKKVAIDLHLGIEDMAETSYDYAPVDTGALRSSILASVKRDGPMEYIYGSHLPYAQRQNYEHKNPEHNRYFERSIWEHTPTLKSKINLTIKKTLGG